MKIIVLPSADNFCTESEATGTGISHQTNYEK